jgi:Protein of unknown function (DUF3572)
MRTLDKESLKSSANAQTIAITIFGWIAQEPDILARFLNLSGLDASQIRTQSQDPAFLLGILDFIMAHEPTLMACCDTTGIKPESVNRAWHRLNGPGSAEYGW